MADGVIRDTLERSIDELPDELRIVFVACFADGMTPEQFAELFALTSETVEARLHNARSLLVERAYTPIRSRLRWRGEALQLFTPEECASYLANSGYRRT